MVMPTNTPQEASRFGFSRSIDGSRLAQWPNMQDHQAASFRSTLPVHNSAAIATTSSDRIGRTGSIPPGPIGMRAASHDSTKENMAPPDAEQYETQRRMIEELKAELGTQRYAMGTLEQEKEMAAARHAADLEDQRRRAQEDYDKMKAADTERTRMARLYDAAQAELKELRSKMLAETAALDKRARDAQEEARMLREQLEDAVIAQDEAARMADRTRMDLELKLSASRRTIDDMDDERRRREVLVQETQSQLAAKDDQIGALEAKVVQYKAQAGDTDTLKVIRDELRQQVSHIRTLEASKVEQAAELKQLRAVARSAGVVEEEKRGLRRRVDALERVREELAESRIQRQRLEDERAAWAEYLHGVDMDNMAITGGADSPEAIVRALVEERMRNAEEVERMGTLRAELAGCESKMEALENERAELRRELEATAQTGSAQLAANNVRSRLERSWALAVKEVECLRAQLASFDAEDVTFQSGRLDETKTERIAELEGLVDRYKSELRSLHDELSTLESSRPRRTAAAATIASAPLPTPADAYSAVAVAATVPIVVGAKRARTADGDGGENDDDDETGRQPRKYRKLQDEMSMLKVKLATSQRELAVSRDQVLKLREQSRTRILSLRSNPTADHEAVKEATLGELRRENAELLAAVQTLRGSTRPGYETIPASTLAPAQRVVAEARAEAASAHKSARRLKEVWASKSAEFKEAVCSTLGWNVTFMPGGKLRVESVFAPSATDGHERSIVFDGERHTMKVGGGPQSAFARRIDSQVAYWVRSKNCVPGFLAALTMDLYENGPEGGEGEGK